MSVRNDPMRYVTAASIRELRVFSTVEELKAAAKPVAQEIHNHPSQPRIFLAILAGDGGYRGCFFPDDHAHRQTCKQVAEELGLIIVEMMPELAVLGKKSPRGI